MKILRSSLFRALCAIVVGVLLIEYRETTMTWLTIAIGVLFFLSGVISLASYYGSRKQDSDVEVFDAEGNKIAGGSPSFPIVGLGSLILGIILALLPQTFIHWLMYILAAILILGAINQYISLGRVAKIGHVGVGFWIMPSLLLLAGIIIIVYPMQSASLPLFILGWCMIVYGVVEVVNVWKISKINKKFQATSNASNITETEAPTMMDEPEKETSSEQQEP